MDLGAYTQIETLGTVMRENGISVDRLRGLRLMSDEKPITAEEIAAAKKMKLSDDLRNLVEAHPRWSFNPFWYAYSSRTKKELKRYYVTDENGYDIAGIRWENLHGKARKMVKYILRHSGKEVEDNLAMFNRFVGRNDVLYIHARQGSTNWSGTTHNKYRTEPWYICSIDDPYDSTYCDIYAKINPITGESNETLSDSTTD
jgi:hypothetical protein